MRRRNLISENHQLAIHKLLAMASLAYDTRDLETLEDCFWPYAQMSLQIAGGDIVGPFSGTDNIMQLYGDAMSKQTDVRKHVVTNTIIDGHNTEASAVSILTLFATYKGMTRLLTVGFYKDNLTLKRGEWRLQKRHVDLDSAY